MKGVLSCILVVFTVGVWVIQLGVCCNSCGLQIIIKARDEVLFKSIAVNCDRAVASIVTG